MTARLSALTTVAALGLLVRAAGTAAPPAPSPTAATAPRVVVRYEPARDPDLTPYAELLRSDELLEFVAGSVLAQFRLSADLTVVAKECGAVDDAYDYDLRTITLCYETMADIDALQSADLEAQRGKADPEELDSALLRSTEFTLMHEVGHALIDLLDLPVVGREEDAADQLAAVLLVEEEDGEGAEVALDGAYSFLLEAEAAAAEGEDSTPPGDEHAADEQRYYDITCWVYGSDPAAFADLVGEGLPRERAERCPAEWQQAERAWSRLLAPHRTTVAQVPPSAALHAGPGLHPSAQGPPVLPATGASPRP